MQTGTVGRLANPATAILSPSFKGVPSAETLARYLLRALAEIKRCGLPVRVYLTQEVTRAVGNLLLLLGVRFKTVPASKMQPPYILLSSEGDYIVVETVDAGGRTLATYRAPFTKFVEALASLITRRRTGGRERTEHLVDEVIVSQEALERILETLGEQAPNAPRKP